MTRSESEFVGLLFNTMNDIREQEWLYSKNENRLCRILENPNARDELKAVHDALSRLLEQ